MINNNNYQIYVDCGYSKLRAGAFNKLNLNEVFFSESKFLVDHTEIEKEIQRIIIFLEKNTNQYIDDVNLMIDSPKMLSIGISISKKIDDSQLRETDIQFLVQEAKQQILQHYNKQDIVHIIINNYKINDVDYDYLPRDTQCNFIALDILFICLPKTTIEHFKSFFYKLNISINQITCSSYAKALNYKDNFSLHKNISFIDVGFNKTSIITYVNNKIISLIALPIGGNHITKDISKVLKIDLVHAEYLKINLENSETLIKNKDFTSELLQEIIFSRIEEILEICVQSIKSNLNKIEPLKMILMGDGSKILDNKYKDKISFTNEINFLEEVIEDICQSGFKLGMGSNKQEVVVIPKKQRKHGFFERIFHFFK
mgnify:CR=1 FL=1